MEGKIERREKKKRKNFVRVAFVQNSKNLVVAPDSRYDNNPTAHRQGMKGEEERKEKDEKEAKVPEDTEMAE
jgi:hypothetical protein